MQDADRLSGGQALRRDGDHSRGIACNASYDRTQ
jgi:hypothetical protein